ncbi:hypothetical protein Tco_0575328 [Tanacetum coccineum]
MRLMFNMIPFKQIHRLFPGYNVQSCCTARLDNLTRKITNLIEVYDQWNCWKSSAAYASAFIYGRDRNRNTWSTCLCTAWVDLKNELIDDPTKAVTFGNGQPLPAHVVHDCCKILDEECVAIPWQKGDVLIMSFQVLLDLEDLQAPVHRSIQVLPTVGQMMGVSLSSCRIYTAEYISEFHLCSLVLLHKRTITKGTQVNEWQHLKIPFEEIEVATENFKKRLSGEVDMDGCTKENSVVSKEPIIVAVKEVDHEHTDRSFLTDPTSVSLVAYRVMVGKGEDYCLRI